MSLSKHVLKYKINVQVANSPLSCYSHETGSNAAQTSLSTKKKKVNSRLLVPASFTHTSPPCTKPTTLVHLPVACQRVLGEENSEAEVGDIPKTRCGYFGISTKKGRKFLFCFMKRERRRERERLDKTGADASSGIPPNDKCQSTITFRGLDILCADHP